MGYLGEDIPKLGFGLMRLPRKDGKIDIPQVCEMTDMFLDAGFTYFDTAHVYDDSEEATREALVKRYPRESYQLATKLAAWDGCNTKEEAVTQLDQSLERTGAEYFDFYLLHNLGETRTKYFEEFGLWDWAFKKRDEGVFKHVGLSFHSTADELDEILKNHPEAEFVQLQINYADWTDAHIQSRLCYETALKYNKPVIVMEPVKGGMLATPPPAAAELLKEADPNASLAQWAIRYAASLPEIITVLSGMSSVEQMRDNLSFMKDFKPLTPKEREVLGEAQKIIASIPLIPCTGCEYCNTVCPENIGIAGTFTAMNDFTLYDNRKMSKGSLNWLVDMHGRQRADKCIQCGACEQVCPQHIAIVENLKKAVEEFK